MRRRSFRGAVTIMAVTTAALIGTAGAALACYPSDDRANPVPKENVTNCDQANQPGNTLDKSDVTFTGGGQNGKELSISAVKEGVTVTAIVVKGGDGYNVYVPGKKGLSDSAPWEKLISPRNGGRQVPTISHWFLCGKKEETKPTETTKPTDTAKPTATRTSTPSTSDTSTTAAPAGNNAGGSGGGLANTGFNNMWLVWVGGLLLVAGGGILGFLKFRRKASN